MKIFRTKERKVYAGIVITLVLIGAGIYSGNSLTRTISDSQDTIEILIKNSDGNYWDVSGANLQLAIWDLNGTGGTVWLPSGTISITTVINMISNVTLIGNGYPTLLYLANGADCDIIDITSKENIHIEKIRFDGNNASNTDNPLIDIQSAGAGGAHTKNITIRDCYFFNCGTSMVDVHYDDNTWHITVEDCYFNGIERDTGQYPAGVWISGFNAIIRNNRFEDTFGSGVVFECATNEAAAGNALIDGNFVTGFTSVGIYTEGSNKAQNVTIVNNRITHLNSTAYWSPWTSYSLGILACHNSTVANNYIHDVWQHGINAQGDYVTVQGNVIDGVGLDGAPNTLNGQKQGIKINGVHCSVIGNIIKNVYGQNAIYVMSEGREADFCTIMGNTIHTVSSSIGNAGCGIKFNDASYPAFGIIYSCVVVGNTIEDCSEDGISLFNVSYSTFGHNTFYNYDSLAIDEESTCYNNTFIGNTARDAGNDYDFDGGGSAVGVEIIANVGQIA